MFLKTPLFLNPTLTAMTKAAMTKAATIFFAL